MIPVDRHGGLSNRAPLFFVGQSCSPQTHPTPTGPPEFKTTATAHATRQLPPPERPWNPRYPRNPHQVVANHDDSLGVYGRRLEGLLLSEAHMTVRMQGEHH